MMECNNQKLKLNKSRSVIKNTVTTQFGAQRELSDLTTTQIVKEKAINIMCISISLRYV